MYTDTQKEALVKVQKNADIVCGKLNISYDLQGVQFIEKYIEKIKTEMSMQEFESGPLPSMLGSFLGETIIRNYGGAWVYDEQGFLCVGFDETNAVYPIDKVRKQFENGLADSVLDMYQTIAPLFGHLFQSSS